VFFLQNSFCNFDWGSYLFLMKNSQARGFAIPKGGLLKDAELKDSQKDNWNCQSHLEI
jgi:hypothetical protein